MTQLYNIENLNENNIILVDGLTIDRIKLFYYYFLNLKITDAIIGEQTGTTNHLVIYQGNILCGDVKDAIIYSANFYSGSFSGDVFAYKMNRVNTLFDNKYFEYVSFPETKFYNVSVINKPDGTFSNFYSGTFGVDYTEALYSSSGLTFRNIISEDISNYTEFNSNTEYFNYLQTNNLTPNFQGIFHDGIFINSNFISGITINGSYINSIYENGIFYNGEFDGLSFHGIWNGGKFKSGNFTGTFSQISRKTTSLFGTSTEPKYTSGTSYFTNWQDYNNSSSTGYLSNIILNNTTPDNSYSSLNVLYTLSFGIGAIFDISIYSGITLICTGQTITSSPSFSAPFYYTNVILNGVNTNINGSCIFYSLPVTSTPSVLFSETRYNLDKRIPTSTWISGIFKNGSFHSGLITDNLGNILPSEDHELTVCLNGDFRNGNIFGGTISSSTIANMSIHNGIFNLDTITNSKISNAYLKNSTITKSTISGGLLENNDMNDIILSD